MLLKKTVKAGLLLYALLMLGLFSLLLQFYLNRQVALAQTAYAHRYSLTAYAMAQMTKDEVLGELAMTNSKTPDTVDSPEKLEQPSPKTAEAEQSQASSKAAVKETVLSTEDTEITPHKVRNQTAGQVLFDQGQATYQILKGQLEMTVSLHSGQNFSYSFPVDSENP